MDPFFLKSSFSFIFLCLESRSSLIFLPFYSPNFFSFLFINWSVPAWTQLLLVIPFCKQRKEPMNPNILDICNYFPWSYRINVKVTQLYPTLCHPMDCRLPGSSVHGISQARILEWVTIPFSRGTPRPRDWTLGSMQVSCIAGRFFTVWATREAGSIRTVSLAP